MCENKPQTANIACNDQSNHFAFMLKSATDELQQMTLAADLCKSQFILDSGATDHLVNELELFTTIEDLMEPIEISIAKKDQVITATKKGTINVLTEDGFSGTLKDVLFVPEIPFNLLSVKRIQESGMDVIFGSDGRVLIKRNGQVILKGICNRNLIYLSFIIKHTKCYQANADNALNNYKLWHERLGKLNKTKFLQLKNDSLTDNSKLLEKVHPVDEICEACLVSKQARLPFKEILTGYVDSDWGGHDSNDRRSTSGYLFKMFDSCTICWNTRRQSTVAVSSTEAEYMALFECVREAIWLRSLASSINMKIENEIKIYEDNQGCISIANNPTNHRKTKHIDIKYHFTREQVNRKLIKIEFLPTDEQIADVLTKSIPMENFTRMISKIGLE